MTDLVLVVVDGDWASARVHPASEIADIERRAREATDGNVGVAFYPVVGIAACSNLLTALKECVWMEGEQPVRESVRFDAWLDRKYRALEAARTAIAQAEGGAQ